MWIEALYPEQRPSFDFVVSRPGAMLISNTSAGKTYISMAALEHLAPALTLIVAPLTSLDIVWAPKLTTLPGRVLYRTWDDFKQTKPAKFKVLKAVLLIHFQLFAKLAKKLERVPWDMVIIDESQGIKDRNSAQSRAARRLRHAKRRLALSATPLDRTPIDIFAQMRFVDPTVLGEDWGPFERVYCYRGGFKDHKLFFRSELLPDLLGRLERHIFRLDKAFLNLPPLTIHTVPVTLLGAQRHLYDEMDKHSLVHVNDIAIPAPLTVTRQVKLEQLTGGTIKDLDERSHHIGNAKLRKLRTLVARLEIPVVIFCKYLAEIPLIRSALEAEARADWQTIAPRYRSKERLLTVEELHGAVVGDERTALINDFQANKIGYLICQMRTGGVSIELTAAATLIFYSMNFSLIDFEQVIGRFHRGSQKRPVDVYVLYAVDTVDEEIATEIEAKKETFYAVVDHFTRQPPSPPPP